MPTPNELQLNEKVASIILAGGQGTRLHPLTLHRSKPAVSFAGKYRLIDIPISNSLNSQINRIFILSQHFASGLQKHIGNTYPYRDLQRGNLEMLCPEETENGINWFLGTADAVRKNIDHLKQFPVEYFLILSGDQLYNIDLIKMVDFARQKKADLVIAALPVKEKEAKRMGLLKINQDHRIVDFIEKPTDPDLLKKFQLENDKELFLGSMGIYVFHREALIKLLEQEGHDFGKDLIPQKIQEKGSYAFFYDGYWEDIGTIDSYYQANLALTTQKNCLNLHDFWNPIYTTHEPLPGPIIKNTRIQTSLINQGCLIEGDEISHSLLGTRSRIGEGTIIRDSIVVGNHSEFKPEDNIPICIGKHCLIEKTILDEDAFIGNHVNLCNKQKLSHYDSDLFYVRDGIIVIPSGKKIPDGFTF